MTKRTLLIAFLFFWVSLAFAQEGPKVLFHLQSADTLVHKSVVTQIKNLKQEIPNAQVEVVCNGPGIEFLLISKSTYIKKLEKLNLGNVNVVACEFTMSQRKLTKQDLHPYAGTVAHGVVEIVRKQADQWLYIKAGF